MSSAQDFNIQSYWGRLQRKQMVVTGPVKHTHQMSSKVIKMLKLWSTQYHIDQFIRGDNSETKGVIAPCAQYKSLAYVSFKCQAKSKSVSQLHSLQAVDMNCGLKNGKLVANIAPFQAGAKKNSIFKMGEDFFHHSSYQFMHTCQ